MSVKELFLLVLGGVLVNNYALEKYLGVCAFMAGGKKGGICGMGIAVTAVMLLTALVSWPLDAFVLAPLSLGYLQILCFVAVAMLAVLVVNWVAKKITGNSFKGYFPLIALNSAVLGLAVNNISAGLSFGAAMLAALGTGLGFWFAMAVFGSVAEKINGKYVPKAFQGLPIYLVMAGIISLAMFAYN